MTRSLGDRAHHLDDVVLATPEVVSVSVEDAAFAVVATDGVWALWTIPAAVVAVADAIKVGRRRRVVGALTLARERAAASPRGADDAVIACCSHQPVVYKAAALARRRGSGVPCRRWPGNANRKEGREQAAAALREFARPSRRAAPAPRPRDALDDALAVGARLPVRFCFSALDEHPPRPAPSSSFFREHQACIGRRIVRAGPGSSHFASWRACRPSSARFNNVLADRGHVNLLVPVDADGVQLTAKGLSRKFDLGHVTEAAPTATKSARNRNRGALRAFRAAPLPRCAAPVRA